MEESTIAKRLYDDSFKNGILGLSGSKEMIYSTLRETYFPFIDLQVNKTGDQDTDEVTFDFYELGTVKFHFCFSRVNSSALTNIICLNDIRHIETKTPEKWSKEKITQLMTTSRIKKNITEQMFRTRILYTVCMKRMLESVIKENMFPYADISMDDISDTETCVSIFFGNFIPVKFIFQFEPRDNRCYLLNKIN